MRRTLTRQRACSISRCCSHDSVNTDYKQQRNNSDLPPLPATAALRPAQSQQSLYLEGNRNPQNTSTPASECMQPPFNSDDDSVPVSDASGGPTPTTPFPFLALIVGSLALLWVCAIDDAMVIRPRFRLRSGHGTHDGAAMGREKGGCRCRVCTLRMQARGQPLHDVNDNVA